MRPQAKLGDESLTDQSAPIVNFFPKLPFIRLQFRLACVSMKIGRDAHHFRQPRQAWPRVYVFPDNRYPIRCSGMRRLWARAQSQQKERQTWEAT